MGHRGIGKPVVAMPPLLPHAGQAFIEQQSQMAGHGGRRHAGIREADPVRRHGGPFRARSIAPVFPIRMLALDVDGTLVHETRVIPDHTREVVRRAAAAGIRVSIVQPPSM